MDRDNRGRNWQMWPFISLEDLRAHIGASLDMFHCLRSECRTLERKLLASNCTGILQVHYVRVCIIYIICSSQESDCYGSTLIS
jgi:hypothetical protein